MAELKKLVCKRKTIRMRVTACYNRVSSFHSLTKLQRSTERVNLLDYKEDLCNFDDLIQNIKYADSDAIDDDDLQKEIDTCAEYRSKIQECIVHLDSLKQVSSNTANTNTVEAARSLLKQPVAPLPSFSGNENEDLMKFIREFELTTAAYAYPDRDLLILLIQQVSGKAKTLLSSLEADKQSYKDAKDLLVAAFASPENLKFSSINKLSNLHLGYGDDPFEFISKVKMLSESVNSLKMSNDDFLQFFVWRGLNENFKSHLIQITNKTKPSFREIVDNFFIANERYSHSQKPYKAKNFASNKSPNANEKSSTSFAMKVNSKSQNSLSNCYLCSSIDKDANHQIYSCPQFKTPRDKLDKIKNLNGCCKCASLKHKSSDCKFKFKRKCRHCSSWHFDFLCPQGSTGSQTAQSANVTSNTLNTDAKSGVVSLQSLSFHTLLPTFSFAVQENGTMYCGLSDRGSQSSLVSERLVSSQNFKVLEKNVRLTIRGFNVPQSYSSSLVEVPLKFGDTIHLVAALVIPEIKIYLDLPQLGTVVNHFKEKGYKLADSFLNQNSNSVSDIDFVLRSDASYCLVGRDIRFGSKSLYVNSPAGALLLGDINYLLHDLPHLLTSETFVNTAQISQSSDHSRSISNTEPISKTCVSSHLTHAFFVSDFVQPFHEDDLDFASLVSDSCLTVMSDKGKVKHYELQAAADQILESECYKYTNYDTQVYNDESVELHDTLGDYALKNISRDSDGRIKVPLLWNGQVSHHLGKNKNLSKAILKSNLKKLSGEHLKLMDQTIKDQVKAGIIEGVDNIDQFLLEHPEHSFLPHMGVFKLDRETTKCRIVFLNNLCEKDPSKKITISHNQAMFAGPTLNQKLSSAFLQLRFGAYLLTYDLKKTFNQLLLNSNDQNKLLFYWYRNVDKKDYSLVVYRNVRLSFGLRCSPFLLMISLYYILVLESESDPAALKDLKCLMYSLLYMDNGAVAVNSLEELNWAYEQLPSVFSPYQFEVQQLTTNDLNLQEKINHDYGESPEVCVKLFGLM